MFKQGQGQGLGEGKKMNMGRVNESEGGMQKSLRDKCLANQYKNKDESLKGEYLKMPSNVSHKSYESLNKKKQTHKQNNVVS